MDRDLHDGRKRVPATIARELTHGSLINKDASIARHLPYTRFLDDGLIATRDGDVMAVFELDGIPYELGDDATLDQHRASVARVMQVIGDGECAVYVHAIRQRVRAEEMIDAVPEGPYFDAEIDRRYREQIADTPMYRLTHYLTLVQRPPINAIRFGETISRVWERLRGTIETGPPEDRRAMAIEKIEAKALTLRSELRTFGIRRLGGSREDRLSAVSFLAMLTSGISDFATLKYDLITAGMLGAGRMVFGGEAMRLAGPCPTDNRVAAILAVRDYPDQTDQTMLDDLLASDGEFILTQSFLPLERLAGLSKARDAYGRMRDTKDEAKTVMADLESAIDGIASGKLSMGHHHLTVSVLAEDEAGLADNLARTQAALSGAGLKMQREDIGLESAWWAQLPGNFAYQARSHQRLISSDNFSDMATFHTHAAGQANDVPWGGPVTMFATGSRTPYLFSFHGPGEVSNGNTLIFGPSGTGKTALAGFLAAQTRRLPRPPRIVYFDKDRGAEAMIRALGGEYTTLTPGHSIGFNPFADIRNEGDAAWLAGFIERLTGGDVSPEQTRRISEAARRLASSEDDALRTFPNFLDLLRSVDDAGGASLRDRLRDWVGSGERAWLFDHEEDKFTIPDLALGIDMTSLLGEPRTRSAALDYLFFRIERLLKDGYPTILFLDEGWKLLDDPTFVTRIKDWLKTIRKQNGIVVFMTQEPSDAANAAISETLVQSAETMLFMASAKADERTYCDVFRLSDEELRTVREMSPSRHGVLIKNSREAVLVSTTLSDAGTLKVLSGTAERVAEMDRAFAHAGEDWLAHYLGRETLNAA